MSFTIETSENSLIKLPSGYKTADEKEKLFVDYINDTDEKHWKLQSNKDGVNIYSREIEGSTIVLLKTVTKIPFKREIIDKALMLENISKWDKAFKSFEKIEDVPCEEAGKTIQIVHSEMIFPFPLANRDYVDKKIHYVNYGGVENTSFYYFYATEHASKPEVSKPVRASTLLTGQYLKGISDNETEFYMINHVDVKITPAFQGLVNKKSITTCDEYISNLKKGCAKM